MKKVLIIAISVLAIFGLLGVIDAAAAAYPTGVGGTGTTASPSAGQVLIGTGNGAYTPAYILCAGTCSVSSASGTITITGTGIATTTGNWAGTWQLYNPSDFVPSSTQIVNTVNGGSGTVTITSSTLGVIWPTVNGNKSAAYQIVPGTGVTSTVSGATTTISVALDNGATQTCSASQFVTQITASGITSCGSVTFPTPATYTFSAGTGISISQATSSSNTTTTITNTGVTSLNGATGTVTISSSSLGVTNASINGALGNLFNFVASSTGSVLSITSSTSGGSSTINFLLQLSSYLQAALQSLNGATSSAQTIVGGAGINVSTAAGASNSTTTVTNTGVTSFTGQGCVTAANSTGTVSLSVTCISGNQSITFTINGDATGTASGATAITDSITVTGLNGKALPANTTGTLQFSGGAWAINLATSSLGVYDANGKLSSYIGSSCSGGQFATGFSATGTVSCASGAAATVNLVGTSTPNALVAWLNASGTVQGYSSAYYASSTGDITIGSSTDGGSTLNVVGNLYVNHPGATATVILNTSGGTANAQYEFFASASDGSFGIYDINSSTRRLTISAGGNISINSASNLGYQLGVNGTFGVSGTATLATTTITHLALGNVTSSILATDANGNVVATTTVSGVSSFNSQTGATTYTNNAGTGLSVTTSTTSSTYTLNINGGSVQTCTSGQLANSISATGTITCQIAVQTIGGINTSTITISGTSNEVTIATTTNSITLSTPQAIGTGSSPTFAGLTITGNVTSTSFTATATTTAASFQGSSSTDNSYIPLFNQVYTLPSPALLALGWTCGNNMSVFDALTCAQDIYNANATVASTTAIFVPYFYQASGTFNANVQGSLFYMFGFGGNGSGFNYTPATGTPITINDCNSNNKRQAEQMNGIAITANSATSTNGGVTLLYAGGTNGACATKLENLNLRKAYQGVVVGPNTYMFSFDDSEISDVQQFIVQNVASNSGEAIEYGNDKLTDVAFAADGGTGTSTNTIYLQANSSPSTVFNQGSWDNGVALWASGGNLNVTVNQTHSEDNTFWYPRIVIASSSQGTGITLNQMVIIEDQTSTPAGAAIPEELLVGTAFSMNGGTIDKNGSATSTQAIVKVSSGGNPDAVLKVCDVVNVGGNSYVSVFGSPTVATDNGCLYSYENNYTAGWEYSYTNGSAFYGSNNGVAISETGNVSGQAGNTNIVLGDPADNTSPGYLVGTSTVDIAGALGLRTDVIAVSSTIRGTESNAGVNNGYFNYVLTNATQATDTLPLIASTSGDGRSYLFAESGVTTTITTATSTNFINNYGTTSTFYTLGAGHSVWLTNDNTYWRVMMKD